MKRIILGLIIVTNLLFANQEGNNNVNTIFPVIPGVEVPLIPLYPAIPTKGENIEEDEVRQLEKTYTVMMESKVNVFVPLEVISDINLEATVVGDQELELPFEVELNRKPEKSNYYVLKYSQNILDIDGDGQNDTYIYSPPYINDKIIKNNYVKIYGGKISKEGTHKKDVYITVEVGGE